MMTSSGGSKVSLNSAVTLIAKDVLDALSFPMILYKVSKLMKESGVWIRSKRTIK